MTARLDPITGPDREWWHTSRRRVFYDAHTPDWTDPHQRGSAPDPRYPVLSEARPEHDLQVLAEAGVDSVVLFAKCQYGNAYYPSEVGRTHAALGGRDLFGEQLAAAHARGIRVIAYYSNMWDVAVAGQRPDWLLEPLASRGSTGRWPALCLRSGYRQHALAQVREIARRYPVDGLWSDILTAGPCACARCRAAFRAEYGRDMPADRNDEAWLDLVGFSQRLLRDYLDEQRAVLRAERPDAAFIPNFYATTFVDAVLGLTTTHLGQADIGSNEGYTDWHGLGFPSYAAKYIRAGMLGRPSEVLVSRFVHTWDFTLRSEAQLRFEAFTVAAHGSTVTVDDQPSGTGAIEPEVYRRLRPVFERIAQRSPWLDGTEPVGYAALWAGQNARELESLLGTTESPSVGEQSAQFPPGERREAPTDLVAAVTGSYRALVESHLPVGFVDERPDSLAQLPNFRVLVLPDVLALGEPELAAIEAFVRAGGGLVVTGPVAVRDARGRTLPSSALAGLLGVDFGAPSWASFPYLRFAAPDADGGTDADGTDASGGVGTDGGADASRGAGADGGADTNFGADSDGAADVDGGADVDLGRDGGAFGNRLIPHYGRIAELTGLAPDVRVLAYRTDPVLETDKVTFWHNNQPAPGAATDVPVMVERTVGAGRVVVSAARLGNNHSRLGHGAYRDLLGALVRRAAGTDPLVTLVGDHRATELVLVRRGLQLVAHLVTGYPVTRLDLHGAQQPAAVEDIAALSSLRLRLPADTTEAARIVDGRMVPLVLHRSAGNDIEVELRDVDDWETVVIDA